MVTEFVARAVRVGDDEVQVRYEERKFVVSAVPDDYVALFLRLFEYFGVIDTGVHYMPALDMSFVLLAFLYRHLGFVYVVDGRETLDTRFD